MIGKTTCPCGCGRDIDIKLKGLLDLMDRRIKEATGHEIEISSGMRCFDYNKMIGGNKNSAHQLGLAVDILTMTSHQRYWIIKMINNFDIRRWGWNKERRFCHFDIATSQTLLPDGSGFYYPEEVAFDY